MISSMVFPAIFFYQCGAGLPTSPLPQVGDSDSPSPSHDINTTDGNEETSKLMGDTNGHDDGGDVDAESDDGGGEDSSGSDDSDDDDESEDLSENDVYLYRRGFGEFGSDTTQCVSSDSLLDCSYEEFLRPRQQRRLASSDSLTYPVDGP